MEKKENILLKNTLNYGAIIGFTLIIYSLILYFFNLILNPYLNYINHVIIFIGILYGIRSYRDNVLGGFIKYGQAMGAGTLMSVFASVLLGIYTFLLYEYMDPDLIERTLAVVEEGLQATDFPDSQIELTMRITRKITVPPVLAFVELFNKTFWGVLFSLIISAILKREGDPFTEQL